MARRMVHVIFVINCFARTGVAPIFSLFDTQVKKYFLNLLYSKKGNSLHLPKIGWPLKEY